MTIQEVAPGKESYGRHDNKYGDEMEKSHLDEMSYVPIPPSSPAVGMDEESEFPTPFSARDAPAVVISRSNRLDWIDGIRGLASIIIFTYWFAELTWAQKYPNVLPVGTIEGFLRYVTPSRLVVVETDPLHTEMVNSLSDCTLCSVVEFSPLRSSNPPLPSRKRPCTSETTSPRSLPSFSKSPDLGGFPSLPPSSDDRFDSLSPPSSSDSFSGKSASTD